MPKGTVKAYFPQANSTGKALQLSADFVCPELGKFGNTSKGLHLARRAMVQSLNKALEAKINEWLNRNGVATPEIEDPIL